MEDFEATARLFLDDVEVGTVRIRSHKHARGVGEFLPQQSFSQFAGSFGRWSLMMHAEDGADVASTEMLRELGDAEQEIDRLHAKLFLPGTGQWRPVRQLVIDGPVIEWEEF